MNKPIYGGQAVIEGVMMRSKKHMTIAVRLENGKIKIKREKVFQRTSKLSKAKFIRGAVMLWDVSKDGMRALTWSANQQLADDEEEAESGGLFAILTTLFSFMIAIGLFKALPFAIAKLVETSNTFIFNFVDGIITLFMLIGYILVISLSKDIRRVWQYHAAEHKAIACYEAGKKLTAKNAQKFRKEHPRCGTNFLFIVVATSFLIYLFIPLTFAWYANFALRLLLLPVIGGVAYEVIQWTNKRQNWFTKFVNSPGMFMQKLTTYEPDLDQLEVGCKSLQELIKIEKGKISVYEALLD